VKLVITHFWVIPQFTLFLSSKIQKNKKNDKKNITVKRGCQNAQKIVKIG
jgi:hypothetical protein